MIHSIKPARAVVFFPLTWACFAAYAENLPATAAEIDSLARRVAGDGNTVELSSVLERLVRPAGIPYRCSRCWTNVRKNGFRRIPRPGSSARIRGCWHASPSKRAHHRPCRHRPHLVDELDRLYGGRARTLASWSAWVASVRRFAPIARAAFDGQTDLHQQAGLTSVN